MKHAPQPPKGHRCAAKQCGEIIPMAKVFCHRHWSMLPLALCDAIYEAYRARDRSMRGIASLGDAWLLAVYRAELFIAEREGREASNIKENIALLERDAAPPSDQAPT